VQTGISDRYKEIQLWEKFYSGFKQVRISYDVEVRPDSLVITDRDGACHIIGKGNIGNGIHDMIEDSGYFLDECVDEISEAITEALETLE
jgi:hypothetical protein